MKLLLLILTFLAVGLAQNDTPQPRMKVPTVAELDPALYVGRWYQTYSSLTVSGTFERNGVCVTATYGVKDASTLTVYNNMRLKKPNGKVSDISGFAYTTDEPGKFNVELQGVVGTDPYWVMKLGPVKEYNGVRQYAYSLVSDSRGSTVYVLVRDVEEAKEKYNIEMLGWLKANGFTGWLNRPRPSYHGKDCLYPAPPSPKPRSLFNGPPTVPELDLSKYSGRWYQTYASISVSATFERNGVCVTATYTPQEDGTVSVYNHMRLKTPTGKVSDINGFATVTDEPGKLTVNLGFGDSPYWVMKLGPVAEYDGILQYSYSLVSNASGNQLYVLVRDVQESKLKYEEEIMTWLKTNHFDSWINRPRTTYHGMDCLYPVNK